MKVTDEANETFFFFLYLLISSISLSQPLEHHLSLKIQIKFDIFNII